MPFTDRTLSFLVENCLMDSREWFHAHKEEYETFIVDPMAEVLTAIAPAMLEIDPEFIAIPKVGKSISRLWRDTRYVKDGSIFRDYVWCTFIREKYRGLPDMWFAVSPRGAQWGCGWYWTGTETMAALRKKVLADDPEWLAANAAFERQSAFKIVGEKYKKSPYTAYPEEKRRWLDQRNITLQTENDPDIIFTDGFADRLIEDFRSIAPVYKFFVNNAVRWEYERD